MKGFCARAGVGVFRARFRLSTIEVKPFSGKLYHGFASYHRRHVTLTRASVLSRSCVESDIRSAYASMFSTVVLCAARFICSLVLENPPGGFYRSTKWYGMVRARHADHVLSPALAAYRSAEPSRMYVHVMLHSYRLDKCRWLYCSIV